MRRTPLAIALLLVALPVWAQQSASYTLAEHTFNAGGSPAAGAVPGSTSFRITMGAIGDNAVRMGLSGPSFRMDGGFGSAYPPPGEVDALVFQSADTLAWQPDSSAGSYNLYRDALAALSGLGFGVCEQSGLSAATATDNDQPAPGAGYFYLVTAENRLGEEGTKGSGNATGERIGTACP